MAFSRLRSQPATARFPLSTRHPMPWPLLIPHYWPRGRSQGFVGWTSFRDNLDGLRKRTPLKALLQAARNWSKQNQEMVQTLIHSDGGGGGRDGWRARSDGG